MFARTLQITRVMVGLGLPDDQIHAPNEKFDVDQYQAGERVLARLGMSWPTCCRVPRRIGRASRGTAPTATKQPAKPSGSTTSELFDQLATDHVGKPGVTLGRTWHNQGLKVNGRIFAMLVRDRLLVKLPAPQAAALVAAGKATAFEPRPGRRVKEWVVVGTPAAPADGGPGVG